MRAAPARLWAHLGWRGLALAGTGALWVWYGVGLLSTDRDGVVAGTAPVTRVMCLEAWAGVWITCGVLATVAGMLRPGRDMWGFAAVALPLIVWGLAFAAAAATGAYTAAWATVPLYAAPLLLLTIVAALTGGRRRICRCERGASDGQ
ncbi:hypothetical protein [Streptomyces corynorhini]|uniref:Integral membrane protein n=1 Tax=Streptomyces corynorhini TaxID=2282652 RepID=A0A370B840_9ACTN|nr:hypothetical protein [Streptomyces corynorhini]RDG37977.1 hypothetical protein DVH02_11680 [Streptomyces corynorhini]